MIITILRGTDELSAYTSTPPFLRISTDSPSTRSASCFSASETVTLLCIRSATNAPGKVYITGGVVR